MATLRSCEDRIPLDGILRVLAESMPCESIDASVFGRKVLLDPNFDPAGAFVAEDDGLTVGFALAIARRVPLENAPDDRDRGYLTLLGVAERVRREGIGRRLVEAAETYLRADGRRSVWVSSYAPGYFIPGVDVDAYAPALNLLARLGYQEVYRPLAMQAPIWRLDPPEWVLECERKWSPHILPFSPRWAVPLLEFAQAEFPGDWVRVVRETSARILAGERTDRLLAAFDPADRRIVGFSHYDGDRFGPVGVAKGDRGRGIGQALTLRTLRAQQAAGWRSSWFMWSDDKTSERLYAALGFREVRRFALLRKDL